MVSDEILKEIFRYFKEHKNCEIEFSDSWKTKTSHAVEIRCKDLDITPDDIIYQLIEDEVVDEYSSKIRDESLCRLARFHRTNWESVK